MNGSYRAHPRRGQRWQPPPQGTEIHRGKTHLYSLTVNKHCDF
ncbi:mCG1038535 [Mus musculus]|nr:mCG1038535 [Mus musculus]